MLVELKNGETLNGHLVNCDNWMNLTLKEVVQTSPEGDRFFRLPEVYVRGNNVRLILLSRSLEDISLLTTSALDKISESSRRGCRIGQRSAAESALESGSWRAIASWGLRKRGSWPWCRAGWKG